MRMLIILGGDHTMKLTGERIYLRFFEPTDAEAMLDLNVRNRDFFSKYVATRNDDYYTLETQESIIIRNRSQAEQDSRYSFGIFEKATDKLIGNIALTEIIRGALQGGFIGYYLDKEYNGRGYMSEAVKLAVDYAFRELKLHRLEAGVMPHNIASIRVLEKAGFKKEGIARKNVLINGVWQDHQMLAMLDEDFVQG